MKSRKMKKLKIYHSDGSVVKNENGDVVEIHSLEYNDEWMGECSVTADITSSVPIDFRIGDYIEYRGERFEINYDPGKSKTARVNSYGEAFKYSGVKFMSLSYELVRCDFLDVVLSDNNRHYTALPKFSFYVESLDDLLDRIQANVDELYGKGVWKLYSRNKERSVDRGCDASEWSSMYGDGIGDSVIESASVSVDNKTCWEALALVNSTFDANFIVRGRNVYVGTEGVPTTNIFKYGKGNGLYEIAQTADSEQTIVTRLRAYGSTKNLPSHYYADLGGIPFMELKSYVISSGSDTYTIQIILPDVLFNGVFIDIDYTAGSLKNGSVSFKIAGSEYSGVVVLQKITDSVFASAYINVSGSSSATSALRSALSSGEKKLSFTSGVNRSKFDSDHMDYSYSRLPNNMACDRLMLPGFPKQSLSEWWSSLSAAEKSEIYDGEKEFVFSDNIWRPYVDSPNVSELGVRPASVYFDTEDKKEGIDEIYPTIEEMEVGGQRIDEIYIGSDVSDNGRVDSETIDNAYIYLRPEINFNLNEYRDESFSISMKDGKCAGRSFEIASCTKMNNGIWRLGIKRVSDFGLWFPYSDFQIEAGDHFVLTGLTLPDEYVEAASRKLLKYALAYLSNNDYTSYVYEPRVDEIYMARQHDEAVADETGETRSLYMTLKAGDIMRFSDEDFGIVGNIAIDKLSIKESDGKIPEYSITLREEKQVGTIQKIQNQISSITNGNGINVSGNSSTANQIISNALAEVAARYLSKTKDDSASGIITFLKGLISKGKVRAEEGVVIGQFVQGFLGTGGSVDSKGNAEFESIFARSFISTPELRYNRITVTDGELWITNGNGIIESIDTENMIITLHLEENDFASVAEGDLCRGIYNNFGTTGEYQNFVTLDADDCGFPVKAGFFTSYFRVKEILEQSKGKCSFRYELRNSSTPHPCAQMKFAQYGNDIDETRQASAFISSVGHFYFESMEHVDTWAIQQENVTIRWGWVDGFAVKNNDGTTSLLKDYGLYVPDNIYFGNAIVQLDPKTIDSLLKEMEQYSIELSNYTDVITVDDAGNVIDGLYKLVVEGDLTTKYDYRIAPAVFVKKGNEYLIEADSGDDAAEGTYKMYVTPKNCTAEIINGTVCVTAIDNIKDGVSGTDDDVDFDYDAMRKMESISVVISVMCEGKGSITKEFKVAIKHDSKPYISMMMDNQNASVSWNTKAQKYIGLPYSFNITAARANDLVPISKVSIVAPEGVTVTSEMQDGVAVLAVTSLPQTLVRVTDIKVTATATYAGINYEQTLVHTLNRYEDVNVYELKPSVTQVIASVNQSGEKVADVEKVTCSVLCSSSDDKQYLLTAEQMATIKAVIKYSIDDSATLSDCPADGISASPEWSKIVFHLLIDGSEVDSQDVPVMLNGVDGNGIEFVFLLTTEDKAPTIYDDSATEAFQSPDYCPYTDAAHTRQWTDEPTGVGINNRYEWVAQRKKQYGKWLAFSKAKKWATYSIDGTSPYSLDLTNESSQVLCDQDGNVIGDYETTTIQLFHGASVMSINDFIITITATNISYSLSGAVITPSAFASGKDSAQIAVKAVLKTNTSIELTSVYSITKNKAGRDGVIYSLQPSVSTFSKGSNGDWVTKSFYLYVKKTTGTSATEITTLAALNAEGLTLKYGSTTVTSSTLELVPSTICGSNTYADLYLYKGGVVIDRERINVVLDGEPGQPGDPGQKGDDAVNYSLVPNMTTISADSEGKVLSTGPLVITLKKSVGSSISDSSDYNIFAYYVYNDGKKISFGSSDGFPSPASIALNGSGPGGLAGYYFEVRNSSGVLAVLSIPLVRQGSPSFSLVDRGLWSPDGSYSYKYDNGILVRDMVKYSINGIYYYYMVAKRTDLMGTNVPITGPSQSPSNTSYWEQGSKYNLLVADVVYADNATLGGFHANATHFWAGASTPATAAASLNGTNGEIMSRGSDASVRILNGVIEVLNNLDICNIRFGLKDGYAVLSYYDNDGNLLYDLGPNGIKASDIQSASITAVVIYMPNGGSLFWETKYLNQSGVWVDTSTANTYQYNRSTNDNIWSGGLGSKPTVGTKLTCYRYTAARINGTYIADPARGLTAAQAQACNGLYFTVGSVSSGDSLVNHKVPSANGIQKGTYVGVVPMLVMQGYTPKYAITAISISNGIARSLTVVSKEVQLVNYEI